MNFEPLTVNIASSPVEPKPADGTAKQIQGKLHYVNVGFALELRDSRQKDSLENLRPILQDKILSMLGRKQFQELTTVQGRYVLRTQIMELTNELAKKALATQDAVVTNVYFTQFLAQ